MYRLFNWKTAQWSSPFSSIEEILEKNPGTILGEYIKEMKVTILANKESNIGFITKIGDGWE